MHVHNSALQSTKTAVMNKTREEEDRKTKRKKKKRNELTSKPNKELLNYPINVTLATHAYTHTQNAHL